MLKLYGALEDSLIVFQALKPVIRKVSATSEAKVEEIAEKEAQKVRDKYKANDGPPTSEGNRLAREERAKNAKDEATAKMKEDIKVKESNMDLTKDWVRSSFEFSYGAR
jgi:hypothetical protein